MGNRFKEVHEEPQIEKEEQQTAPQQEQKNSPPQKKGGIAKSLTAVFAGNFLGNDKIFKQLPFIFFLSFIALFYIANGYWADDKIRQLNSLATEIKELRNEQISVRSELDFAKQEEQIIPAAKNIGLLECRTPPMKILVRDSTTIKIISGRQ